MDVDHVSLPVSDAYIARQFHLWAKQHPDLAEQSLRVWYAAWRIASWQALRMDRRLGLGIAIHQLGDVLDRMERMQRQEHDLEIENELEAQSAYWTFEVQES